MKWWIKFYKIDSIVDIIVGNFISLIKNIILLQKYEVFKGIAKSTTYYYWNHAYINIKGC